MRTETITYEIFKFDELSPDVQEKVIDRNWDWNVDHDWWEYVYEDAEHVGLKITSFDAGRAQSIIGDLFLDVEDCIIAIRRDHGKDCATQAVCDDYEATMQVVRLEQAQLEADQFCECFDYLEGVYDIDHVYPEDYETHILEVADAIDEFKCALLEEYLHMLRREYEYRTSDAAVKESIICNECEFLKNGDSY